MTFPLCKYKAYEQLSCGKHVAPELHCIFSFKSALTRFFSLWWPGPDPCRPVAVYRTCSLWRVLLFRSIHVRSFPRTVIISYIAVSVQEIVCVCFAGMGSTTSKPCSQYYYHHASDTWWWWYEGEWWCHVQAWVIS